MNEVYFFDSYAIIEVLRGSKSYRRYLKADIITSQLNLFEVYYAILKQSKKHAEEFIKLYEGYTVPYTTQTIKTAAQLKLALKNRKLSMADCIGYVLALEYRTKFLTGDKEFQDLENVEYVK
ncbi:MAG: type II toxin-antitoxin system VapC family toxin [Candidatus Altiarchaeales archaeon]|nr:type II toxin-antitoxin system VapC family toxin [Candidatus Altiarchaeales archaeon]